jgi:Predicted UDP-glucose 6-dehydrogenase
VLENINVKNFTAPSQQVYTLGQNLRLGIVGRGFVGGAVSRGFNTKYVEQYIVDPRFSDLKLKDLVNKTPHVIFICVPTPSRVTDSTKGPVGSVDSDLINTTLNSLSSMDYMGIIVIKSTVAPTVLQSFRDEFTKLNIVYNPEFLTEVNANNDFVNPPFQIFGGDWDACTQIEQIYIKYSLVRPSPTFKLDIKAASFLKYTINSWLATKVVFFNELRKLYATYDMSTPWSEFIGVLAHEPRVGSSHMNVPGPDGQFGFGGNCFPKDTKAFVEESRNSALLELLEKAIEINNNMRTNT